jgi:glyceraldehyde 3-phosphate dehydrogenase
MRRQKANGIKAPSEKTMRVGINGLCRIGRGFLKTVWDDPRIHVVALNDVAEGAVIAHLLSHDSYYGLWQTPCRPIAQGLEIGREAVPLFHFSVPDQIPWDEWGVDWVVDATGRFKDRAALARHRCPVLLTSSSRDVDRQVVFGVNHLAIDARDRVLSATSCTTHCIAPPLAVLSRRFGAKAVMFNTVHCYNVSQTLVDAPQKDLRRARAAALNLIPTTSSASLSLESVLPELAGKVQGMAVRVPVPAVSLTEITLAASKEPDKNEVLACLEEAAEGELAGIMALSRDDLVSQDFLGNQASSIVDLPLLQVRDGLIRLICWYDNEAGYIHRLIDLLAFLDGRRP